MMSRFHTWLNNGGMAAAGVVMLAVLSAERAETAEKRPNVLFIAVDDWNDWTGPHGGNQAITPNLDRLAKRGVTFRYAHASAVYCAPSRTSLMTGRNCFSIGAYHDQPFFAKENHPKIKDLPRWFADHGYHTVGGGKLYHHMPGFIDMRGWNSYYHWRPEEKKAGWGLHSWGAGAPLPDPLPNSPIAKFLEEKKGPNKPAKAGKAPKVNSHMEWGVLANEVESKMADTLCFDWAAGVLKNYRGEKPLFLGVGAYAPHKPNFVPQKYFDLYPLDKVQVPQFVDGDLDDLPEKLRRRVQGRVKSIHEPVQRLNCAKQAVQGYLAALSYTDALIGKLLDALEKSQHAENTVIVLWSDNGYHLGEKGCWAKHTLWERTSNVPLMFAGPGVAKGAKVDVSVSLLDVYPTLLSLAGLPANTNTEGVDLSPVLKDPTSANDRTVIQCLDAQQYALINMKWRYVRTVGGEEQLYAVDKDPGELKNLAADPAYAETLKAMRKQLPQQAAEPGLRPRHFVLRKKEESFTWSKKDLKGKDPYAPKKK